MSQENVERIRAGFDAHNRGDLDFLVELYDREAVFETLLLGTHHGNEAIRVIYEENQKTLSGYDVVPVELIDAGDKIVAVAQAVGSGPASEIAVDEPFAFVFTFRGERVIREQAFRNKEEALEAVGPPESPMSQENVEIVRRYYEAYAQGGFEPWVEYWSDDLDHRAARDGIDDPGPVRGKNAMRKHIRDWIDTFDDFWFEAVELIDAGEETVVVVERFGGRAKLSGVETNQTSGVVLTIREGKIARCREYATRAEALAAAGLSE